MLTRVADVTLKERRKLVLMFRETPFNLMHCRAVTAVTEAGAIVAPPVPAFYIKPRSIEEIVDHSVARALDLLDVEVPMTRWGESGEWDSANSHVNTELQPVRE